MKKPNRFQQMLSILILSNLFSSITFAATFPTQLEGLQGNIIEIKIPLENNSYTEGNFDGQKIIFQKEKDQFKGYLGINRLSDPDTKNLIISQFTPGVGSKETTIPVTIKKREFRSQYFSLQPQTQKLFGKDYQTPTWDLIYNAMANPATEQLWQNDFILPTTGKITLGFGDKLYINKVYSGSHFGIDYANKQGTPVYATNTGIVKLASMTAAYGNVIVIDHGLNIYSMYLHLNSFNVKAGDQVKQGDLIGKIGSTGLAEGPHLHFTMFVGKTVVDSNQWIKNN